MKRGILLLFLLISLSIGASAQQYKIELPYVMVGSKMVVEVEINGSAKKMIFDTGAFPCSLSAEIVEELNLSVNETRKVTDVNSRVSHYDVVTIKNLIFPKSSIGFAFKAIVAPSPNPFVCFDAVGIIGSEILTGAIVEIDSKNKIITITSAEQPSKASLRVVRDFLAKESMPIFETGVGTSAIMTLFDTGYGGFISLKESDYMKLSGNGDLEDLSSCIDAGSIGLAGRSGSFVSHRVAMDKIMIGGGRFSDVVVATANSPYTLIGTKLLEYGKVTIDYPRRQFFFEPFQKENLLEAPLNDFSLMVTDGELVVGSVWSSNKSGVAAGDKIVKVDGQNAKTYDFCESITTGIQGISNKKRVTLTIATKEGMKKVDYFNSVE